MYTSCMTNVTVKPKEYVAQFFSVQDDVWKDGIGYPTFRTPEEACDLVDSWSPSEHECRVVERQTIVVDTPVVERTS